MSNWYYADRDRQRHGPMDAAALAQAFNAGRIGQDALVWREGLPDWQPLGRHAAELGLLGDAPVAPPPADPAPFATESVAPAAADWRSAVPGATVEPASPYAAPRATIAREQDVVDGGEIVYAGFLKRFAAATLDGLIVGAVMFAVLMIVVVVMGVGGNLFSDMQAGRAPMLGVTFVLLFYLVPFLVQAAYFTLMHASGSQATLGKLAVGIKVVRSNGERISVLRSFGRFAGLVLLGAVTCGVTQLVSAIMAGITARKQGLHDMMSDTLVVDRWAFTAHPERQRRELGAVTITMLVLAGLVLLGYVAIVVFAGIGAAMSHR